MREECLDSDSCRVGFRTCPRGGCNCFTLTCVELASEHVVFRERLSFGQREGVCLGRKGWGWVEWGHLHLSLYGERFRICNLTERMVLCGGI